MERVAKGLAGVVVDDTRITDIDGEAGALRYRGYPIEELAEQSLPDVIALILDGEWPSAARTATLRAALQRASALPTDLATTLLHMRDHAAHPMLLLQSAVPLLTSHRDAGPGATSWPESTTGFTLAARLPAVLALALRGEAALADVTNPTPFASHDYGAALLRLLTGTERGPAIARAFETTQILQIDHGFNAGTFAARVIASTLAPIESAVSGAIGALYGALHGGADQAAIDMARRIGSPEAVPEALLAMRRDGEKVMGMGHREYRVIDPRAKVIVDLAARVARQDAGATEFAILRAVAEHTAMTQPGLHPNVEFYKGVVFLAAGLPTHAFTGCFALARVWGYLAHFAECREHNRILRPAAAYCGAPARTLQR